MEIRARTSRLKADQSDVAAQLEADAAAAEEALERVKSHAKASRANIEKAMAQSRTNTTPKCRRRNCINVSNNAKASGACAETEIAEAKEQLEAAKAERDRIKRETQVAKIERDAELERLRLEHDLVSREILDARQAHEHDYNVAAEPSRRFERKSPSSSRRFVGRRMVTAA